MTIAYDNVSNLARTTTADPTTWTHTGRAEASGGVQGVIVITQNYTSATDQVAGVTYGGVALTEIVAASDAAGEPTNTQFWFVGSGLAGLGGSQTVSVDFTSATSDTFWLTAITYTSATGGIVMVDSGQVSGDATDPRVTLNSKGLDVYGVWAIAGGLATTASYVPTHPFGAAGASDQDSGQEVQRVHYATTTPVNSRTVTVGYTSTVDDVSFVAGIFAEAPSPVEIDIVGAAHGDTGTVSGNGTISLTMPSNIASGDVAVVYTTGNLGTQSSITFNTGSWTQIGSTVYNSTVLYGAAFWAVMAGTESGTTLTATLGNSARGTLGVIVFRNVDTTAPIAASASTTATPASTTLAYPAATTTANDQAVIGFGVGRNATNGVTFTFTAGTNYTERTDDVSAFATGPNNGQHGITRVLVGGSGVSQTPSSSTSTQALSHTVSHTIILAKRPVKAGVASATGTVTAATTTSNPWQYAESFEQQSSGTNISASNSIYDTITGTPNFSDLSNYTGTNGGRLNALNEGMWSNAPSSQTSAYYETWFKISDLPGASESYIPAVVQNSADAGTYLRINTSGQVEWSVGNATGNSGATTLSTATWYKGVVWNECSTGTFQGRVAVYTTTGTLVYNSGVQTDGGHSASTITYAGSQDLTAAGILSVDDVVWTANDRFPAATGDTNVNAGNAAGTAAGQGATGKVNASAGVASATGTANGATGKVDATAGSVSVTGTANNVPIKYAAIQAATGAAAAQAATGKVNATAGVAAATGTSNGVTGNVKASAGVASATGTSNSATGSVRASAGIPTGVGASNSVTGQTAPTPSTATAAGAALNATQSPGVPAGVATAAGAAEQPSITTDGGTNATADPALSTGTAHTPTAAVAAAAGSAAGSGTAQGVTAGVAPLAASQSQLWTNGYLLTDATGWTSGDAYDAAVTYNGHGTYRLNATNQDAFGPIVAFDRKRTYQISATMKSDVAAGLWYFGWVPLDYNQNVIGPAHSNVPNLGSLTTLAQPVKNGDLTIELTSATGWDATSVSYVAVWNYTDGDGTAWGPNTYTRNIASIASVVGTTVTLNAAWSLGSLPAGTPVSKTQSAGSYKYFQAGQLPSTDWSTRTAQITGPQANASQWGTASLTPPGMRYIRYVGLNLSNPTGQLWIGQAELLESGPPAVTGTPGQVSPSVQVTGSQVIGAGAAQQPTSKVNGSAGSGAGTGTANGVTGSVKAQAGVATAAGTAYNPPIEYAQAQAATASGVANAPTRSVSATAQAAAGAGAAQAATGAVKASAGLASAAGAAYQPTIQVAADDTAPAENALGSVTVSNASGAVGAYAVDMLAAEAGQGNAGYAPGTVVLSNPSASVKATVIDEMGAWAPVQAYPPTTSVKAQAGVASAAGAANNVTRQVTAAAATGSAAGQGATGSVAGSATVGTGSGTAQQAAGRVNAQAAAATATGTAGDANAAQNAPAGVASATGSAPTPSITTTQATNATADPALATGTANPATGSVQPSATVTTVTGAANTLTARTAPTQQAATGTAAGQGATGAVRATAGVATAAGTANQATSTTTGQATTATGSAAGLSATGSVSPTAVTATGQGTANDVPIAYAQAQTATASGAALNATVPGMGNAQPEVATGAGTAHQPTTAVAAQAGVAAVSGVAHQASTALAAAATPQAAAATGAALSATGKDAPTPTVATAAGTATTSTSAVTASAGVAAASGTSNSATVSTDSATNAPAGAAPANAAAQQPTVDVKAQAGVATAAGTAPTPSITTTGATNATADPALGSASALNATVTVTGVTNAQAGVAGASGTAYNATGSTTGTTNAQAGVASASGASNPLTATLGPIPASALAARAEAQSSITLTGTAGVGTVSGTAAASAQVGAAPDSALASANAYTLIAWITAQAQAAAATGLALPPEIISERLSLRVEVPPTWMKFLVDRLHDGPADTVTTTLRATVVPTSLRRLVTATGDAVYYEDITLVEGDALTLSFALVYKDTNGAEQAFNLTGYTGLTLYVKNRLNQDNAQAFFTASGTIIAPATNGVLEVPITSAATTTSGRFHYSLTGTSPTAQTRTLAHGEWIVEPT